MPYTIPIIKKIAIKIEIVIEIYMAHCVAGDSLSAILKSEYADSFNLLISIQVSNSLLSVITFRNP